MHYKLFFILLFFSNLMSQSLYNNIIGSNSFIGSARSTAIGNTHLLNSTGSSNTRFNPAKLIEYNNIILDFQYDRNSTFERWSMPFRDNFDEFLIYGDYVANKFDYNNLKGGIIINNSDILQLSFGLSAYPLTNFHYFYSEEVRGKYPANNELYSRDPIVGYHHYKTKGTYNTIACGIGTKYILIKTPQNLLELQIGTSLNMIQASKQSINQYIDTLYSDVSNLSNYDEIESLNELPGLQFFVMSTNITYNSNMKLGLSFEQVAKSKIIQYIKPEMTSIAFSHLSNKKNNMSIHFEFNNIAYKKHLFLISELNNLNIQDYKKYKFGFEFFTQSGTAIRGGLSYNTSNLPFIKPISIFTYGAGKTLGKITIDFAGTYVIYDYLHPDLFPVADEIRNEYDRVIETQTNLQILVHYQF